jgi:hypothetical protein
MSIHNATGTPGMLRRIARFVFSRTTMVFYEYHYNNPDPSQPPQDGFTFRALELPSDYGELSELFALQRDSEPVFKPVGEEEAMGRLQKGEVCYIGESQGRILGYSWFAKGEKYIPEIESTICLGSKDLYLYNSYILKAYRRQNIVGGNLNAARKDLVPRGFAREITATMDWNKAAGGSLVKLNFRVAGTVTAGYFLTFRYMYNGCRDIAFRNGTGVFGLYRKLFSRFRAFFYSIGSPCLARGDDDMMQSTDPDG